VGDGARAIAGAPRADALNVERAAFGPKHWDQAKKDFV
jgi:hypothetical protein